MRPTPLRLLNDPDPWAQTQLAIDHTCWCASHRPCDAAYQEGRLNPVVCLRQPPNTPVSIKTGVALLAISKAEAGPDADGCIAAGSVWIPSGVHSCDLLPARMCCIVRLQA